MKTLFKGLAALAGGLTLLAGGLVANALRQTSQQVIVAAAPKITIDEAAAAQRLAEAITIKTVSFSQALAPATAEFKKFHALLETSFPKTHASLKLEKVGDLSLLYLWQGSDSSLLPIMLMAHQDVVPVAPGTEDKWTETPFSGVVKDGFIWGRGTWDDKGNLMAMLEAVEMLVSQGYKPKRSIYLAFGHDEEIGGNKGAAAIAALLKQRSVRLEFVLDEGLLITEGVFKALDKPLAWIGIAEKGNMTADLVVTSQPGHSSMPPQQSAIGRLAVALAKLEAEPMPANIGDVTGPMLTALAPELGPLPRLTMSNLWLFAPVIKAELAKAPSSNAMLRTTTALTIVNAGEKDNVLPGKASAAVNFRLMPGDTVASVVERTQKLVGPDVVVTPRPGQSVEASPVSSPNSAGFKMIERVVRELFQDTVVAPGLMIAGTDGKHMQGISKDVYRFSPVRAKPEDLSRFHGTNERLAVSNFAEMIRFYHRLLTTVDGEAAKAAKSN
jgi:carboxypeptidase PM20D1